MAGKCRVDVSKDIISAVNKSAVVSKAFDNVEGEPTALQVLDAKQARLAANQINKDYREEIVKPSYSDPESIYTIEPSDKLVDKYLASHPEAEQLLQTPSTEIKRASPAALAKVNEYLKRIGVEVSRLDKILDQNGKPIDANGRADMLKQLVEIVNGKEDVALTEEAMHFAVDIIEQKIPALFQSMLNRVGETDLYKTIIADNSDMSYRKIYQKDGKPDIRKIKKEVMGKLLAQAVIDNVEKTESAEQLGTIATWWANIKNFLKNLFNKSNIDPFGVGAKAVLEGKAEGKIELSPESYLQTVQSQSDIDSKLAATQTAVTKVYRDEKDNNDPMADDADINNWYEIAGKKVKNRVTDLVKTWYKKRFGDKQFSDFEKRLNETKRENGVKGHLDFERTIDKFVDPTTHQLRAIPFSAEEGDPVIGSDTGYKMIYDYVKDLIAQHPKDTKWYREVVVYDEKKDEAGTIDLLAVDPDGKTHIYDWKFLSIGKYDNDVSWFKQGAYEVQIREYRRILKDVYGVKDFGETRAIPIITEYSPNLQGVMTLESMSVGNADATQVTDVRYLPVAVDETTGIETLDKKIAQLVRLYNTESDKSVQEHRRDLKAEKLNTIKQTLRLLRTQTNLHVFKDVMDVNAREMQALVDKYNNEMRAADVNSFSDAQKSEFANSINEQLVTAEIYKDVDIAFDTDIAENVEKGSFTEERAQDLRNLLSKEASKIRVGVSKLYKIQQDFADRFIAEKNDVTGLLSPQRVVKGLASKFTGMSTLGLKSLDVLFKLASSSEAKARTDALVVNERIASLRDKTLEWARTKGIKKEDIGQMLYQKDSRGKRVHLLIDEIKSEFYTTMKEKARLEEREWFEDNINMEAYRKEAAAYYTMKRNELENTVYPGSEQQQADREAADIEKLKKEYDIDNPEFTGWGNRIMKKHIQDRAKWQTNEYKKIVGTPLEELYKEHQAINKFGLDIGYLQGASYRRFTPFLRKNMVDKILWGGNKFSVQGWLDDLAVSGDPQKYGATDEEGNIIPAIPKYYTRDIGKEVIDGEGNKSIDYSDVSEDLFPNLIEFNNQLHKYKYFSDIEGQIRLLQTIEEFKGHLETNNLGKVAIDPETNDVKAAGVDREGGNAENAKLLDEYVRLVLYKQKYPQSSTDTSLPVGKIVAGVAKMINSVAGRELIKVKEQQDPTSMMKMIDGLNTVKRTQVLSLNPVSGMAVLMGNNIQVAAQSGEYFSAREFIRNEMKIIRQSLTFKEQQLLPALMNTFLPMNEDLSQELFKRSKLKKFTNKNIGDWLMMTMSKPDQLLEKAVFMTLLDNVMVNADGKFVNINKYVKDKYAERYNSGKDFKATRDKIAAEIKELKATKSISKTASVDGEGHLSIPGFNLKNQEEIIRLSQLSKVITQRANANVTEFNKTQMQLNAVTNAAMVFRNWIPGLTATRFASLTRTADSFEGTRYDIGRVRLLGHLLTDSIKSKSLNVYNILRMNDAGIAAIDRLLERYKQDYFEKRGEKFDMDRNDFIDLIRNNVRNEVKELAMLCLLTGSLFGLKAIAPGKDDDKQQKNLFNAVYRMYDKMQNELSFFYDPRSFLQLTNASVFPATGIFTDLWHFTSSVTTQAFGDDEDNKTNHPSKYFFKLFPVSNAWLTYIGTIDPTLAKDLNITIPTNADQVR